jgi:hypothetical protein
MRDERATEYFIAECAVDYRGQSEMHHGHNLQSGLPVVVLSAGHAAFWNAQVVPW